MSSIFLKPRMSEKAYALSKVNQTYVFDVPLEANKLQILEAVIEQYKVSVENVRTTVLKGDKARSIRIGGARKQVAGRHSDLKKAYVKIKKGEKIPIFAAVEEAEQKEKKAAEKAEKKLKKEKK